MDVCMPVCMHNFVTMQDWGYGGMLPKEIIFRCSEIASEAILEQSSPYIFKKRVVWLQAAQLPLIVGSESTEG